MQLATAYHEMDAMGLRERFSFGLEGDGVGARRVGIACAALIAYEILLLDGFVAVAARPSRLIAIPGPTQIGSPRRFAGFFPLREP